MTTSTTDPTGVRQEDTPSGLSIYKQDKPKRLYKILPDTSDYEEWVEVSSVTEILKALNIPLQWYGMEVGVAAIQELINRYQNRLIFRDGQMLEYLTENSVEAIVSDLIQEKLTVNHDFGKQATKKGTNVHKALEVFAETGVVPNPDFYPEDERGFITALVAFINDAHPHTLHSELMVASRVDGWAGTLDWIANLDFAGEVVTKTFPKREDIRTQLSGCWLIDAKTSSEKPGKTKAVWPSYHIQAEAYRKGFSECGYGEVNHVGVLRLINDGRYELVESIATYQDFLNVLEVHRSLQRIGGK